MKTLRHAPAADDEVGGLVAPRDGQAAGEITRLRHQHFPARVDMASMTAQLLVAYAVLWVVAVQDAARPARVIPPECARCGLAFERRELGGAICTLRSLA